MPTTSVRSWAHALAALAFVACASSPRVPQVEQVAEATHGGAERYRAHRACLAATTSVDGLVACMREAGWDFVSPGGAYPEPECWAARHGGDRERLAPHCFVRTAEDRRGTAP